jgi:hypothetical protein
MMPRNQNGSASSPSATISIARSVSPAAPRPISPNAVRLSNNSEYRHPATAGEKSKYAGTKSAAATHRPTLALGCCNRRRKAAQETAATASTSALVAPMGAAFAASTLKLRISAASIIAPTLPVRTAQSSQFPVMGRIVANSEVWRVDQLAPPLRGCPSYLAAIPGLRSLTRTCPGLNSPAPTGPMIRVVSRQC